MPPRHVPDSRRVLRRWALACAAGALAVLGACDPAPDDQDPVLVGAVPPVAAGAGAAASPGRAATTLHFAAFSQSREVFGSQILPAFTRQWRRQRGRPIEIEPRFVGSEALADQIAAGYPADVAVFAHAHPVEQLERLGLVAPAWRSAPHGGIVCRSLVVLAVRAGNPAGIRDWSDLARPGVSILTPDPTTSGGGAWNVCAIYGAALRGRAGVPAGDRAAAKTFLASVLANAVGHHANTSEAYAAFRAGTGDVAITSESEIALGWLFGSDVERVIPQSTVLIESAAAVIDAHVDARGTRALAEALRKHLWSAAAQRQFAFCGLRPVDPDVAASSRARFPDPADLWTIEYLGGWEGALRDVPGLLAPAAQPPR
jgi:sulfate/thiosulfate-binding protein